MASSPPFVECKVWLARVELAPPLVDPRRVCRSLGGGIDSILFGRCFVHTMIQGEEVRGGRGEVILEECGRLQESRAWKCRLGGKIMTLYLHVFNLTKSAIGSWKVGIPPSHDILFWIHGLVAHYEVKFSGFQHYHVSVKFITLFLMIGRICLFTWKNVLNCFCFQANKCRE